MRSVLLLLPLITAACVANPKPEEIAAGAGPSFSAQAFFSGRTQGDAVLRKILSKPETVRVQGTGRVDKDGVIVLDQTVNEAAKPAKHREWRIREVAPGQYSGTLSGADGPVVGDVSGNRLHLRYPLKGGLEAEQWMILASDGRLAQNHMTVRKLGIVVARLDETIRKLD